MSAPFALSTVSALSCLVTLQGRGGIAFRVGLVGYGVAGTFLSAAYLEFFYNLVALTVVLQVVARPEMSAPPSAPRPDRGVAHVRDSRAR